MRRRLFSIGLAMTLMGGLALPARAGVVIYAIDSQNDLNILNASDGSLISSQAITGLPGGTTGFDGLAYDPFNNMLYGEVGLGGTSTDLVRINTSTGAVTTIGPINGGTGVYASLAFDASGNLYSLYAPLGSQALVKVDITNGNVLSSQALSSNLDANLMTGSNIPGTFYGTLLNEVQSATINAEGTVTAGPYFSQSIASESFFGTTLYSVGNGTATLPFGTIDPATGQFTQTGTVSDNIYIIAAGLSPASTPEPASLVLLISGVAGVGAWRWRAARRRAA